MKSRIKLNQIEAYDKAYKELESMYNTDGGKKFLHHLIYAFYSKSICPILFPESIVRKHKKGKNYFGKKKYFDCLSKSELGTVYNKYSDIDDPDTLNLLKEIKDEKDDAVKSKLYSKLNDIEIKYIHKNQLNRIAIKSIRTNKILGMDEYQALIDFIKEYRSKDIKIKTLVRYLNKENKPKKEKFNRPKIDNSIGSDELKDKLMKAVNS